MTAHIKLYGSKQQRFEQVKARVGEDLGYEPSNPEIVGLLMAAHRSNASDGPGGDNAGL